MNGIHDMGGMHGMGRIHYEKDEPVFHERWEARAYALARAMFATPSLKFSRYDIESIPAAEYLRMSYYERWIAALVEGLVGSGLVTRTEIESGKPVAGSTKASPALRADMVAAMEQRGFPARRQTHGSPRFKVGQRVRARNIHPSGHTRLPRYARGKIGRIVRNHGVFVFPDTNVHSLGEKPQHVYTVRFAARDLWGPQAAQRDGVYIDLWEDYLERA